MRSNFFTHPNAVTDAITSSETLRALPPINYVEELRRARVLALAVAATAFAPLLPNIQDDFSNKYEDLYVDNYGM